MEIVEGCQGAETLKLTYTPWVAGYTRLIFPNDGDGEAFYIHERGKEFILPAGTTYRTEHHPDEDVYVFYGTGINRTVLVDGGSNTVLLDCEEPFYWQSDVYHRGKERVSINEESRNIWFVDSSGNSVGEARGSVVTKEHYERRDKPLTSPTETQGNFIYTGGFRARDENNVNLEYHPLCPLHDTGANYIHVRPHSLKITGKYLYSSQYSTYVTSLNRSERFLTKRMTQPIEIEEVEPQPGEPVEIEFTDLQGEYDFYLEEYPTEIRLYKQFKFFDFTKHIASIPLQPGLPRPEYSIVCDLQSCPEGTCEVECGSTICCYGADGVAVKSFEKK